MSFIIEQNIFIALITLKKLAYHKKRQKNVYKQKKNDACNKIIIEFFKILMQLNVTSLTIYTKLKKENSKK